MNQLHRVTVIFPLAAALVIAVVEGALGQAPPADVQPANDIERRRLDELERRCDGLEMGLRNSMELISWLSRTSPPVGSVMAFAGAWPPRRGEDDRWSEEDLGWILCDGRQLDTPMYKELATVLNQNHAPDLRGLFLRGIDRALDGSTTERDKGEDDNEGQNRGVLHVQNYATALPQGNEKEFKTNTEGEHSLTAAGRNRQGANLVFDRLLAANPASTWSFANPTGGRFDNTATEGDISTGEPDLFVSGTIRPVPSHSHTIVGGGNRETRPINSAVFWIIKFK